MEKLRNQSRRRRGAPRGNKNAAGNRGNRNARGVKGNRGGRGAPIGNQYARKFRKPHEDLLKRYGQDREVAAWILEHAVELDEGNFTADHLREPALHQMAALKMSFDEVVKKRPG